MSMLERIFPVATNARWHRLPDTSGIGTKPQFAQRKAVSGVGGKADLPVERSDFPV